jgi:hypothetical protein
MSTINRAASATIFSALAVLCAVGGAHAATSIKTCGVTIDAPGSYVVTRNLTVKPGQTECIFVNSDFVTLDLGGFTIDCANQGAAGISDHTINFKGVIVRNGLVTRCTIGILLDSRAVLIDGVSVRSNSDGGIFLGNSGSLVIRSISNDNAGTGPFRYGLFQGCPANALENTLVDNDFGNYHTDQAGCNAADNLIP